MKIMDASRMRRDAFTWKPWLTQVRRELHRNPELGLREFKTSETVRRLLDEMGIPCERPGGGTAVVGLIAGKDGGKTVALRADMDALPITEPSRAAYCSRNPGVMHACGHDAHMAIQLGAARMLFGMRESLCGNIKLLFQPAEETVGGARTMVKQGCMENPHVDCCIGLHVMPHLPVGKAELKYGVLDGASNPTHIVIHGRTAHGAYPELGVDAIVIASQVVSALQTFVSREISPLDPAVFTVGTIRGGSKSNIIADKVEMDAILRTVNPRTREFALKRIPEIVKGVSASLGGSAEVEMEDGYPALINDGDIVNAIRAPAEEILGKENVVIREKPSLGVEDFSYFLGCCKGAFYHLGCALADGSAAAPLHSPGFDIDEDCLPYGVLLQSAFALTLLETDFPSGPAK